MTMQLYRFKFNAMGSPCGLTFYHNDKIQAQGIYQKAVNEVARLENKYSRYLSISLLSKINQQAGISPVTIDAETHGLLAYAEQAYQISDSLFDITTGVLRYVWDFKKAVVPAQETIERQLALVDWKKVIWDEQSIYLSQKGMEIDFGGIVKEYAADSVASQLKLLDIKHGLVDLGGDIHVIGPRIDGQPWPVGITDPLCKSNSLADIPMTVGGLASSGDYERNFVVNGKKYSHILNPKTGWPSAGLSAVSVWCEQTIMAGTLSTIAMLKEQEGIIWLKELEVPYVAMTTESKLFTAS